MKNSSFTGSTFCSELRISSFGFTSAVSGYGGKDQTIIGSTRPVLLVLIWSLARDLLRLWQIDDSGSSGGGCFTIIFRK